MFSEQALYKRSALCTCLGRHRYVWEPYNSFMLINGFQGYLHAVEVYDDVPRSGLLDIGQDIWTIWQTQSK